MIGFDMSEPDIVTDADGRIVPTLCQECGYVHLCCISCYGAAKQRHEDAADHGGDE